MFRTKKKNEVFDDFMDECLPVLIKASTKEYEEIKAKILADAANTGNENICNFAIAVFNLADMEREVKK